MLAVIVSVCGSAATEAQTFPSPGAGAYTWERVGNVAISADGLAWSPGGQLLAVGLEGFYSLNGGGPAGVWTITPMPRSAYALIAFLDGLVLAGDRVIDRSTDGLPPWTRVCQSQVNGCTGPEYANAFLELPPGHAHTGRVLAGNHNYSDDRGLTWTVATHPIPTEALTIAAFALLPSGRILAAGAGWGLVSSDDGGASWQASNVYVAYRYAGYGITALATPGSIQSGNPSCGLPDPALCEGAVATGTDATDAYNRTWWTNDGGRSWTQGEPLVQDYDGCCWAFAGGMFDLGLDPVTGLGRAVTVLGRGFVFATRDGGQTWDVVARAPVRSPDQDVKSVRSAVLDAQGRLYVSVFFGGPAREWVYRTVEPVTQAFAVAGEAGPVDAAPGVLGVSVRPNPAGGRVEVVLTTAEASSVRVVITDALGREVAVVLDGAVASGEHVVGVDTAAWPAGVYVVRVTAGSQAATARLVVAR